MKKLLIVFAVAIFVSGCGSKTYYSNNDSTRSFEQDVAYCKSVAIGSVPMPTIQQYQNNTQPYAPSSGTMRDQYGNVYRYQENYNPMAAAQGNMAMAQQNFNNAATSLQNSAAQLEAQGARNAEVNQCMAQLGWRQISEKEYEHRQQLRANPHLAVQQAAEQGNANAQYWLAMMYFSGKGARQDPTQAVRWAKISAEQGNPDAQHFLGRAYVDGYGGLEKSETKSVMWQKKAAEQGHPIAQDMVGDAYFYGSGVPEDKKQAMEWYRKAVPGLRGSAENGMAEAQFRLAGSLFSGSGVAKDEAEALIWLKKAAEQGYQPAQNELSKMKQAGYL